MRIDNHVVICPHEHSPAVPATGPGRWVDQSLTRMSIEQVVRKVRNIAMQCISENGFWDTTNIDAKSGTMKAQLTNKETRIAGAILLGFRVGGRDPGHAATLRKLIEVAFGPAAQTVLCYCKIKDGK